MTAAPASQWRPAPPSNWVVRRWAGTIGRSVFVVGLVFGVLEVLSVWADRPYPWFFAWPLALFVGLIHFSSRVQSLGDADPALKDLMDLPAVGIQFPVEVIYRMRGVQYGVDQGIISISGGWMTFQGRQSEFNVNSENVRPPGAGPMDGRGSTPAPTRTMRFVSWGAQSPGMTAGGTTVTPALAGLPNGAFGVSWHYDDRWGSIEIKPYWDGFGPGGPGLLNPGRALREWLVVDDPPEGPSLLPPQAAQPGRIEREARRLRTTRQMFLFVPIFAFAVAGFLSLTLHSPSSVSVVNIAFPLLLGLATNTASYIRISRNLRELRKLPEPPTEQ